MSGNKTDKVITNDLIVDKSTRLNKNVYIKNSSGCGTGLKVDAPSEFWQPIQATEINAPPDSGGITIEGVNINNGVIGGGGGGGSKWHHSQTIITPSGSLVNDVPEVVIPTTFGGFAELGTPVLSFTELPHHSFTGPAGVPYTVAIAASTTGSANFRITEIPIANVNDTPAPIAAANRILDSPVTFVDGINAVQEFTVTPTVTNSVWFYHKTGATFTLVNVNITED